MAVAYPTSAFHFQVEWGGSTINFTECSGLDSATVEVIKYRQGGSREYSEICFPGRNTWSELTLKRGIFQGDDDFAVWFNTIRMNVVERRDITISLLNEEHEPILVWKVKEAWPSKYTGPSLNSTGNDVAIEEMTIQHEGIFREMVA